MTEIAIDAEASSGRRPARDEKSEALAASEPSFTYQVMSLIRYLFSLGAQHKLLAPFLWVIGAILILMLVIFIVGLPVINGSTLLFNVKAEADAAERAHELKLFELKTDVELKKMDRTMLDQGAIKTLSDISGKLDQQRDATQQVRMDVQSLSVDVQGLRASQANTDRRVSSLAEKQRKFLLGAQAVAKEVP